MAATVQFEPIAGPAISINAERAAACAWGDYDGDGWLDLLVSNTRNQPNGLYRNLGQGSFDQVNHSAGIPTTGRHSHGVGWCDFDGDGDAGFGRVRNRPPEGDRGQSIGCVWADFDNDGYLDLFVANGNHLPQKNALYANNGDGTFRRLSGQPLVETRDTSAGCAVADYDQDGFLDLAVANYDTSVAGKPVPLLYRNRGNANRWLHIRCVGTRSNRSAIGATVRLQATIRGRSLWQRRQVTAGDRRGSESLPVEFGLGDAEQAETLEIRWPSGLTTTLRSVPAKQMITVVEGAETQTLRLSRPT